MLDSVSNFFNGIDLSLGTIIFLALLIAFLISFVIVLFKKYAGKKNQLENYEYFLDIVRALSFGIRNKVEMLVVNDDGDVLFTTHPHLYKSRAEFLRNMLSRIKNSTDAQIFCEIIENKKRASCLIECSTENSSNGKKYVVIQENVDEANSFTGEELSIITMFDASKQIDELQKYSKNYSKLESFLDNFVFGLFYLDKDGIIIGSNNTFANMIGIKRDKIIGSSVYEFFDEFNKNATPQKPNKVMIKPKFATKFPAMLIKSAMQSVSSMQPWIVCKFEQRGISEQDEKPLQKGFLDQDIFAHARIPTLITTLDAKVVSFNPAFAEMLQDNVIIDEGNILKPGISLYEFINPKSREKVVSRFTDIASNKYNQEPVEIEFNSGEITAVLYIGQISGNRSDESESLLLIQIVDISEQKKLEAQFIQSQKMQAVGQLAGGIAHDFNNLLTAMIGFCDLLLQKHPANDPSYSDVVQIKQSANRAANLVRQLLAFSRQQTLKPKVISVTDILVELSSLLKRLIGANIEFSIIHGKNLWPVKVDTIQFEQVIMNLAVNARDAMGAGGKLTIKTQNLETFEPMACIFEAAPPGEYILIEVQDTGCGIDPEILEKIFEPFFSQKDKDGGKRKSSGTGLGLSTVYGIVKQTGGYIKIDTAPGAGANFKILLPRYIGPQSVFVKSEAAPKDLSGTETILLVEDEDPVRMFSARALRDKGYTVIEAEGGEEALKIVNSGQKFDLLITDVVMPKMDGPTLNRIIRDQIPDLKTIFISGYTEDTFRKDLDKDLDIHFLQKPFTLKDLANKTKEVLLR